MIGPTGLAIYWGPSIRVRQRCPTYGAGAGAAALEGVHSTILGRRRVPQLASLSHSARTHIESQICANGRTGGPTSHNRIDAATFLWLVRNPDVWPCNDCSFCNWQKAELQTTTSPLNSSPPPNCRPPIVTSPCSPDQHSAPPAPQLPSEPLPASRRAATPPRPRPRMSSRRSPSTASMAPTPRPWYGVTTLAPFAPPRRRSRRGTTQLGHTAAALRTGNGPPFPPDPGSRLLMRAPLNLVHGRR